MKEEAKKASLEQVLAAFQSAKVINDSVTLKQLGEVSSRLKDSLGSIGKGVWSFISPNYVYEGDDPVDIKS